MIQRLKIAIADDDRDTREYLEEFFTIQGHEVGCARDGQQLVELCRRMMPDLIVTDFAMPKLDGLAAAAVINSERSVPVVLLTGRHDIESEAVTAAHVVRLLCKPVKNADLHAAIQSALPELAGGIHSSCV